MSGIGLMLLGSSGGIGQQAFITAGTFTWVVPNGVTSCSVVCVGGGAGGSTNYSYCGGAGALAYVNNISVTPGESMTVVVGSGGNGGNGQSYPDSYGYSGSLSSFKRSSTVLVQANGGSGLRDGSSAGGTVAVGSGGNGGAGGYAGGGAGGYSGTGGAGATSEGVNGSAGSGGGGGGGANENETRYTLIQTYSPINSGPYGSTYKYQYTAPGAGGGGGVGILGSGSNGSAGVNGTLVGGGGGGGSSGNNGGSASVSGTGSGGTYGGGGGGGYRDLYVYEDNTATEVGAESITQGGGGGAAGAVRIIFPASGAITREFPSTNTGNL